MTWEKVLTEDCFGVVACSLAERVSWWKRLSGLFVFRPKPTRDCLADVLDRFFLIAALRDASGQSGTLDDNPAIFGFFESHMKHHDEVILNIDYRRVKPFVQPCAASTARATRKAVLSRRWLARTCMPTGRPADVLPHGTVTPQMPASEAVTV